MTEKFVSPAPPPTAYQRELLQILTEECAEVQKRAMKACRFGPTEIQPGEIADNAARLSLEVGDVLEMIDRATKAGLIYPDVVAQGKRHKCDQLAKYMQHEPDHD